MNAIDSGRSLLGVGIYTVPDAARLTRIRSDRIRRWTQGYYSGSKEHRKFHPPIWATQVGSLGGVSAIGFLDLMELRFVNAFVDLRLPLGKIREAAELAQSLWGINHPFASRRFRTDGKTIFVELAQIEKDTVLLDLVRRQFALYDVLEPTLFEGVEFGEDNFIHAWRPMTAGAPSVILDPARNFGQPTLDKCGIPTAVLARAVKTEGSIEAAAAIYEVDETAVREAIFFELETRQAA
jgi:uncharacterized protein (DUF433 family)